MNRFAILSCVFGLLVCTVESIQAAFVNGDLVILTTADNVTTSASAVTLNNYSYNPLTGTFSTTPTTHPIAGLTLPGAADHDGMLHLSTNGNYLTFGGYQAASGTPTVITSASPRFVGQVDSNWNLSTVPISGYTGLALRSVVSTDGQHYWTGGDAGATSGQFYIDNSGPITQTLITADDARANRIVDGQLWAFNSGNGGTKVGTGLPTSATTSAITWTSPYVKSDAIFLDLDNNGVKETAYSTDGKNLLGKWHFDGSAWAQTGSWTGTKANINDINSLEAFVYNGDVKLLAATQGPTGQPGQLFLFTDSNGINNNFSPAFLANTTPSPFLTAGGTASFRGMAILTAVPEPVAVTLLATAISFVVGCRRRRSRSCEF